MRHPLWREWKREVGWLILRFFRWVTRKSIRNCQNLTDALEKAEREIELTKKELQEAQDQLKDIERLATEAARESAKTLSGSAPRGEWSYAKGQNELANPVLKILGLKQHKPERSTAKRIFKRLFL